MSIPITPNALGNFAVQLVCPYLADTTATTSNLYICTDSSLDGNTQVIPGNWANRAETKLTPGWFTAGVLLFAKISVNYFGRSDAESGFFGGSFHISSIAQNAIDIAPSNFNYINR